MTCNSLISIKKTNHVLKAAALQHHDHNLPHLQRLMPKTKSISTEENAAKISDASPYDTDRIGVTRAHHCQVLLLPPPPPASQIAARSPHCPPCDCELECWTVVRVHVRSAWHGPPGVDAPAGRAGVRRAPVGSRHKHKRCSCEFRKETIHRRQAVLTALATLSTKSAI